MSWSLQLVGGDLNIGGVGGYSTVTGAAKLMQDIKNWILEPQGTDPSHPDYGCLLDGGIMPDGTISPSTLGNILSPAQLVAIESEVRRVLNAVQQQQQDRLARDQAQYGGRNTFSSGEVLLSVASVSIQQVGDTANVNVVIVNGDGSQISFSVPIS